MVRMPGVHEALVHHEQEAEEFGCRTTSCTTQRWRDIAQTHYPYAKHLRLSRMRLGAAAPKLDMDLPKASLLDL
jgi:hypothetical protein